MDYTLIYGYDRPKEVEELFTEYTNMLVRLDPLFQESLDEQNYSEEMAKALSEDLSPEEKDALYEGLVKLNQFFVETIKESNNKHK